MTETSLTSPERNIVKKENTVKIGFDKEFNVGSKSLIKTYMEL